MTYRGEMASQHSVSQHSVSQHSVSQHSLSQHSLSQHSVSQHSLSQHSLSQHFQGRERFGVRILLALVAVVGLLSMGCSTVPVIDGVRANELSSEEVIKAARSAREEGDPARSAELLEFVIQHDYDRDDLSLIRLMTARSWFEAGQYEDAYEHDRRLMLEDPFTEHSEEISDRAWTMGTALLRSDRTLGDDREVGLEILNFLVTRFSRSSYSDDAWKELALDATLEGQHRAAIDIYERLLRDHPQSEWADLALFEAARSYAELTRGKRYDIDPLLLAHAAFGRYLRAYPDGNFVSRAVDGRKRVEHEIALRELEIAAYYRARGEAEGERVHLANAAARFPDTPAASRAREILRDMDLDPERTSEELLRPRQDQPIWRRSLVSPAG